ncbi:PilZ domain-containing protein [uncultured Erythrobacter sp.]|uniref:PilZ domain-containing protein n=1 Tax=uncultured Erythrobacter sp. TaxID=263913 RepID=UPI00261A70E4|nr:PilZ domain-containing protein [uncultured Erythrobacter sp.]
MRTRQINRKLITLHGRYSTGLGEPQDVTLRDLSPGGCRFELSSKKMAPGAPLQIFVGSTGPHRAVVKWIKDGEAGVNFLQPLSEAQFNSFQTSHIPNAPLASSSDAFDDVKDMTPQRFC